LQPTALGAEKISQMTTTYAAGIDFMTDFSEWQNIQNGAIPTSTVTTDPVARFLIDGRALAAYTHVDQLYQAYLLKLYRLTVSDSLKRPFCAG
jgi:hypothetical protein